MQNSAIKTLFCNIKQKINHSFDGEKHMKRRIFTTLDNLVKRDIFDAKYAQLEKRRENLDKQIRREEREAKIVLAKENVVEFTAKAKKYAKKQAKKRHTTQSIFTLQAAMQKTSFWVGSRYSVFIVRTR